jgi:thiosulfate reductase cytochrome b subunit
VKQILMYTANERLWHWIQALTIGALLVTGAEVHAPQTVHIFGFAAAVVIHNAAGALLLLNAILGLFYFMTSGMIRQYIPAEREFANMAFAQAKYYLSGIFRGEPHPMEHGPENKLNPLQKITYLAILNLLLPLQMVTGVLIWAGGRWPQLLEPIGGLTYLVPIHALAAWFFLSFTIMHIYLTTTGDTPMANIRAMIVGTIPAHDGHLEPGQDGGKA